MPNESQAGANDDKAISEEEDITPPACNLAQLTDTLGLHKHPMGTIDSNSRLGTLPMKAWTWGGVSKINGESDKRMRTHVKQCQRNLVA